MQYGDVTFSDRQSSLETPAKQVLKKVPDSGTIENPKNQEKLSQAELVV